MAGVKLNRRGGLGPPKAGAVQFLTLRIATEIIDETPWECFAIIARAARCKGLPTTILELRDARDLGHVWQLVFEVAR